MGQVKASEPKDKMRIGFAVIFLFMIFLNVYIVDETSGSPNEDSLTFVKEGVHVVGTISEKVNKDSVALEAQGHGYSHGDIVKIKTGEPSLNDIVIFNPHQNKSMCTGFGPHMQLGKITGLPGEKVSFKNNTMVIRNEVIQFDRDHSRRNAIFGGKRYENLTMRDIILQPGEYLLDKLVGNECSGVDASGNSIVYDRFTVNKEALIGIIVGKIGHDDQLEKDLRNRSY